MNVARRSHSTEHRLSERTRKTAYQWSKYLSPKNVASILDARRNGATISLNQVQITDSQIDHNCLVLDHVLAMSSRVGRYTIVGPRASLFWADLGPFTSLAEKVTVGAMPHYPERATTHGFPLGSCYRIAEEDALPERPRTTVGADVWLSTNVVVRAGVRIGHGAVAGAGSIITRDVDDYEVVVGVPARRLRMRFSDDIISRLLRMRWWEWPPARLRENVDLFRLTLTPDVLDALEERSGAPDGTPTPAS